MADGDWSSQLIKFGYESQQRFDYYVVALTFTVLGLAIQTAHFGANHTAALFELTAWLLLLMSGLAGIARLSWQPKVFQFMGLEASQQSRLTSLREAKARGTRVIHALDTGTDLEIDGLLVRDQRDLQKIDAAIKSVQAKSQWSFRIHSVGFLGGMICLGVARGLAPLLALIAAMKAAT